MSVVDRAEDRAFVTAAFGGDVAATGLKHVWDHIDLQEPTPTNDMLRSIVGALAAYLRETGYTP